ncbi:hypothetical protein F5Y15DRAFT_400787 [Xylariaceae sp. FL0016]|nr:hypothetical protein F5Y15DRAFT_400787 [Xylariaceae sp. FL0016]
MQLFAVASTTSSIHGLPKSQDGFHLDPPMYYPPTTQPHSAYLESAHPSFPFYQSPPSVRVPQPVAQGSRGVETPQLVDQGNPDIGSPQPSVQDTLDVESSQAAEQGVQDSLESHTPEPQAAPAESYVTSDQVHIVGVTLHAKFLAHSLAAMSERPPLKIIAHHPSALQKWGTEGRTISLYTKEGVHVSDRGILCPEPIGRPQTLRSVLERKNVKYLDNVIINTQPWAIEKTLHGLSYRMDNSTTVCLINSGLGLIDRLNERVFTDPKTRPNFVLGHSTHRVERHLDHAYSLRQCGQGKLFLHADSMQPLTEHFISLMSASQSLGVVSVPWPIFLGSKLPKMVFESLAESISVTLGCRYSRILKDEHAMSMWRSMLDETMEIIKALPELQDWPMIVERLTSNTFRARLKNYLYRQGKGYSPWISWIRYGQRPPIDLVNGYFVKRAKEVGVDCRLNEMAMSMVRARQKARYNELKGDIPLGLSPYMMDGDKIGGGQKYFDEELDLDMTFEDMS